MTTTSGTSDPAKPALVRKADDDTRSSQRRVSVSDDATPVHEQLDRLTATECVDKDTALKIMRLYHSMDAIYNQMVFEKDKQIEALRSELVVTKLTHKHADTIDKLVGDVSKVQSQQKTIVEEMASTSSRIDGIEGRVVALTPVKRK